MATAIATRLVICVDNTPNIPSQHTNITRLYHSVKCGRIVPPASSTALNQVVRLYDGIPDDPFSTDRLLQATGVTANTTLRRIEDVYEACCRLRGHEDEVWLFGFGRGAYVVRAVAGLLNQFGALATAGQPEFQKDIKKLLRDCERLQESSHVSGAAFSQVSSFSSTALQPGPTIRFVGVFDTVKPSNTGDAIFDTSFAPSITHFRHALALHEDRKAFTPDYVFPENFYRVDLRDQDRSCVQAWFIGTHGDLGGTASTTGLALYPLQWMLLEALACGLVLDLQMREPDNPLRHVFPSLAGSRRRKEEPLRQWSCTTANGIEVDMQDLRDAVTETSSQDGGKTQRKRNQVRLRSSGGTFRSRKTRETFTPEGRLRGYCDSAPQGTIIHPSVYLLLDGHMAITLETKELQLQRYLEDWRERMLGTGTNGVVNQGFWMGVDEEEEDFGTGAIRVLVCGNTGVGKSTLINKIFGVDVTQSSNRTRGIHDVREEIVFEGRPDLIVHDSGGFEAGAEEEFQRVEEFLKAKSSATDVQDRLHVIWFCIDINSARTLQTATEKLFRAVSDFAEDVPIVVVATKKDDFLDIEFGAKRKEMKKEGLPFHEDACERHAEERLVQRIELIRTEMESVPGGRLDACLAVSQDDPASIQELSKTTSRCFDTDKVRLLYIRAQVSRIDLKIDMALCEVTRRYKRLVASATGATFAPLGASITRKASNVAVTKAIITCFGLPSVSADAAVGALKTNIWNTLGSTVALGVAETFALAGLIGSIGTVGMPVWLVTGAINASYIIPATCRLFLIMSVDLTLVLARSFKEVTFRGPGGQPSVRDVSAAARNYKLRGYSQHVHRDIKTLVPRRSLIASYKTSAVATGVESIVTKYKDGLLEDVDLPLQIGRVRLGRAESVTSSDATSSIAGTNDDDEDDDDVTLYTDVSDARALVAELEAHGPEYMVAELDANRPAAELPAGAGAEKRTSSQEISELAA